MNDIKTVCTLDLRDSDVPPSPNRVKVDSGVRHLLLRLEVDRRECRTESESHRGCYTPFSIIALAFNPELFRHPVYVTNLFTSSTH